MQYKHKKYQLFRKSLEAPKRVVSLVYDNKLTLTDYITYELYGKVPVSCLLERDRRILEKFGLEKIINLDWELLLTPFGHRVTIDYRDILDKIPKHEENLNDVLYEVLSEVISPDCYSAKMRTKYPHKVFEIDKEEPIKIREKKERFNRGTLGLENIVKEWELFKEKDLSYCLEYDDNNSYKLTDKDIKDFMSKYESLAPLIAEHDDIYKFIYEYNVLKTNPEKITFITRFTDKLLEKTHQKNPWTGNTQQFTNEEYRQIFKYSSLEKELKKIDEYFGSMVADELKRLSPEYLFDSGFPFELFQSRNMLYFFGMYGFKNTVEFDKECGNFFSKDNFRILKAMYETYLHYSHNADDDLRFYIEQPTDENGNIIEQPYRKDDFYETIRRMLVNGPTNYDYASQAPNYSDLTGEFRKRFPDLFISEEAPEVIQTAFYTKKITPILLSKYPEGIKYLEGKDLQSCFKREAARVKDERGFRQYVNLYDYLQKTLGYEDAIKYILDYSYVLEIYSGLDYYLRNNHELTFEPDSDFEQVQKSTDELLRRLIIDKGVYYPTKIPNHFKETYPTMFLPENAPYELKQMVYERKINRSELQKHPEYRQYLSNIDAEVLCKHFIVWSHQPDGRNRQISLMEEIKKQFGKEAVDIALYYGHYLERTSENEDLVTFKHDSSHTKDDILEELDRQVYNLITSGKTKYDEFMSDSFKKKHPTLFVKQDLNQELKDKFYNREFTIEDFMNNLDLISQFGDTNIICGLSEEYGWLIPLFSQNKNQQEANQNRLKVLNAFLEIKDISLQYAFKEYMSECIDEIDIEKVGYMAEVLHRLSKSNSQEMFAFRKELAVQILRSEDPIGSLNKIENIFIKNNIPTVGKIYSCFEILHPNFQGFNFNEFSTISPVLKNSTIPARKAIVFADLLKASFGSNNRSINNYVRNIDVAYTLYEEIISGKVKYEDLDENQKKELVTFSKHLATLYGNSRKGKQELNPVTLSSDPIKDITELRRLLAPNDNIDYNLADRVINMFCHFAGIETLEQAKEYIQTKIKTAEERNIQASKTDMVLEEGDYIKGIAGGIQYLGSILQNGSVSKEYLGASAGSDATPLDTDISRIMTNDGTNKDKILGTAASGYGDIWFVLKGDDRFQTTRDATGEKGEKRSKNKIEVFSTGVVGNGHYGIRTGFASSEINYIVLQEYDEKVALEIVMNGFYIPIANQDGKIIFTYEDYKKLQSKMNGLSHYGQTTYVFSNNLVTPQTEELAFQLESSNIEVIQKRSKINEIIISTLQELNLQLKTTIDGDLTEGFVELIDTGSTGRGTNIPGDGDFDFIMRIDKKIFNNPEKLNQLKSALLKKLSNSNTQGVANSGDFKLKGINIDPQTKVDIDITFVERTNQISYSTDMCLQDRLQTIYNTDKEKYKYVIANILLAKKVLKEANVYKRHKADASQGGLGGVGIENWILQNGGSFYDAAKSFIEAANNKSYDEFKESYRVWDFGENHLAARNGYYSHDNFVFGNMSEVGYKKMTEALKQYIKVYEQEQTNSKRR